MPPGTSPARHRRPLYLYLLSISLLPPLPSSFVRRLCVLCWPPADPSRVITREEAPERLAPEDLAQEPHRPTTQYMMSSRHQFLPIRGRTRELLSQKKPGINVKLSVGMPRVRLREGGLLGPAGDGLAGSELY